VPTHLKTTSNYKNDLAAVPTHLKTTSSFKNNLAAVPTQGLNDRVRLEEANTRAARIPQASPLKWIEEASGDQINQNKWGRGGHAGQPMTLYQRWLKQSRARFAVQYCLHPLPQGEQRLYILPGRAGRSANGKGLNEELATTA